jgi:hypothetical protein
MSVRWQRVDRKIGCFLIASTIWVEAGVVVRFTEYHDADALVAFERSSTSRALCACRF